MGGTCGVLRFRRRWAISPTWAGRVMSGACFLVPNLRPGTAPLPSDSARVACTSLTAKGGLGPSKSLRGCRGGALPR